MSYLYCGDNLGTIKEYNINKLLGDQSNSRCFVNEVSRFDIKGVTFISFKNDFTRDIRLGTDNKKNYKYEIYVGYFGGIIEIFDGPLISSCKIPKIRINVSGEIIFLQEIPKNYVDNNSSGNTVLLVITNCMTLYLLRVPIIDKSTQETLTIDVSHLKGESMEKSSDYLIDSIRLPGTNISCVAYNIVHNSIAYAGYESDIKLFSLKRLCTYWNCKNLQANMLKHRIPVDVTKLAFLYERNEIILSGTGFGEIRIYSPNSQKRPLINFNLWNDKSPVTSLIVIKKWDRCISSVNTYSSIVAVGNNKGSTLIIKILYGTGVKQKEYPILEKRESALSGRKVVPFLEKFFTKDVININDYSYFRESHKIEVSIVGSFKGILGGITAMNHFRLEGTSKGYDNIVSIGGPGRYIYLFDLKKRKLIKKIFTSQKISFMSVI